MFLNSVRAVRYRALLRHAILHKRQLASLSMVFTFQVVITDYPDIELIDNMRYNVANCGIGKEIQERIAVEGYVWGSNAEPLLSHLDSNTKFDVLVLSDTVKPLFSSSIADYRYSIILNTKPLSNLSYSTLRERENQRYMFFIVTIVRGSRTKIWSSLISQFRLDLLLKT